MKVRCMLQIQSVLDHLLELRHWLPFVVLSHLNVQAAFCHWILVLEKTNPILPKSAFSSQDLEAVIWFFLLVKDS